jgi:benzoate transport
MEYSRAIIDNQKMTFVQFATILLCFLMNMLDGMDVLVIAFAAPQISAEWGILPQSLGWVFSAAVIGMTLGALLIAPQADRFGRKAMILFCLVLMGVSIFVTSYATTVTQLIIYRFASGLGIGGMLASASTLSSEYAPARSRGFWVSLVMGGYPVGAVGSGLVAAEIIPNHGWSSMFQFAGVATLATIPLVLFFMEESLEYLIKQRPAGALARVNRILAKMKVPQYDELPALHEQIEAATVKGLFKGELGRQTILLWTAFFMAFATLYFLLSWIPKLTTAAGLSERLGIYSGTVFNLGSFVGIAVLGGLTIKLGLRKTILIFLGSAAFLMMIFGFFSGSFMVLVMFGFIGFTMQAGFVGLYPVAAQMYPSEVRTTGVGWGIGAGRFGAVAGPILAGYLVAAGLSLTMNFIIFAIPCIIAGIVAMSIHSKEVS